MYFVNIRRKGYLLLIAEVTRNEGLVVTGVFRKLCLGCVPPRLGCCGPGKWALRRYLQDMDGSVMTLPQVCRTEQNEMRNLKTIKRNFKHANSICAP